MNKKYTNIYAATKTVRDRKYIDYRNIIVSSQPLLLREEIDGYVVKTNSGEYNCDFI